MDTQSTLEFVDGVWDESIVPALTEYIRIPNKSPAFDPDWQKHGYMAQAVDLIEGWCKQQEIEGLTVEVLQLGERTPLIYMEIPGEGDDTVLLYGHLDKQPEFTGWVDGLEPWKPVMRDGKLYGRGGADDGYAAFASLTAIRALRRAGGSHARCVVLIEACEESGSATICRPTSSTSRRASAVRASWSASIRAAATTISCGARRRCAAWSRAT